MALKDFVLQELEHSRHTHISGQALSQKLGVTRSAVWKAIQALKEDGHQILSSTNKGYRLSDDSDVLSATEIAQHLKEAYRTMPIWIYPEIDSTNTEAKRLCSAQPIVTGLVTADCQTGGKGRLGRSFYSPAKTGIYLSVILSPKTAFQNVVFLTTAASVAVYRAVLELTGQKTQIKWVNDVYLNGKKLCGILTEGVTDMENGQVQNIIVGIGVNITTDDFPGTLSETATALHIAGIGRNKLIAAVANHMLDLAADLSDRSYLDDYKANSLVLGKDICYVQDQTNHHGKAVDIDKDGGLVVQTPTGQTITLNSGEISIRLQK